MSDSTTTEQQPAASPFTPTFAAAACHLYPRREPFDHGLLPIPKLIFTDGAQTLSQLKSSLLLSSSAERVDMDTLAQALQIPVEHVRLLIETISSVLRDEFDPLVKAAKSTDGVDKIGVHIYDLLMFLYIQSYKRLLPKGHRDSAAVADVWPSTLAFDGSLYEPDRPSRLLGSQAELYLGAESFSSCQVLSLDKFEHLGFLLYFGEKGSIRIPFEPEYSTFRKFGPSSDMPAAPVPASQVLDWLLQIIASTLEFIADRVSPKDNIPSSSSDEDVQRSDAGTSPSKPSSSSRGPSFIDGFSKSSCVKQASDLKVHLQRS
ncbi:tubulin binding cofactor C [Striga asiatica]|uniref:Tubulin binding cofactor C n=1 Tax=Striga asiatica TaxID=4170 RepID=A0A5A7RIU9_STRAF|nr:tubulin binding cofactor C [Striga asiatica]